MAVDDNDGVELDGGDAGAVDHVIRDVDVNTVRFRVRGVYTHRIELYDAYRDTHHGFPLMIGEDAVNNINCFKDSIPSLFHPYISRIQDVNPDGNCGFRSVAVGLGLNENRWLFIRQQLLHEMDSKEEWWRTVFDRIAFQEYDRLRHTIDWQDVKAAPVSRWMWMPYTGLLIAQRFGVIVHLLSIAGNQTFFPLWFGPHVHAQHQIVSFVHVKSAHFIHVKLDGDFPMPPTNALWNLHRNDDAAEWENIYSDRIERFKKKMATDSDNFSQYVTNYG
ncbi:hypothetical protein L1987_51742 [Smallanthus sonchifolius]|uniref:Uncharacterized protein n=1 Tax=Smallanthus sonchifolius TaxID=185202 RepID=A0ACB9ERS6_9ASTR|nr:hypothetical protein L1987_51742 [Smallanthus sonchifolius]